MSLSFKNGKPLDGPEGFTITLWDPDGEGLFADNYKLEVILKTGINYTLTPEEVENLGILNQAKGMGVNNVILFTENILREARRTNK